MKRAPKDNLLRILTPNPRVQALQNFIIMPFLVRVANPLGLINPRVKLHVVFHGCMYAFPNSDNSFRAFALDNGATVIHPPQLLQ